MDKNQLGARLLQDLLQKAESSPEPVNRRSLLCFWRRRGGRDLFEESRKRISSRCVVVCLQIHNIVGLPAAMDRRVIIVGWRAKGWKGEQTLPVDVRDGAAAFDEIFLHYCDSDVRSLLKSFTICVSLVDAADCDLGTFDVDLSDLVPMDCSSDAKLDGRTLCFDLVGAATGGFMSLSVYCRVMEEADHELIDYKPSKIKWFFSCLPDMSCLKSRPPARVSAWRIPSIKSDPGFITIENPIETRRSPADDGREAAGFITLEKGAVYARSRRPRPPSDDLINSDEDEKPCLAMDAECDVEKVEDEFLRLLEEKFWKSKRSLLGDHQGNLSLDLDLESLIREAEMELAKAAEMWRSSSSSRSVARGAVLEKEEYEELMMKKKRWESNETTCVLGSSSGGHGFGSPI